METFFDGIKVLLKESVNALQDDIPMTKVKLQELGKITETYSTNHWIRIHYEIIREHVYLRAKRGLFTLNYTIKVYNIKPIIYTKMDILHIDDIQSLLILLKQKFPDTNIWIENYEEVGSDNKTAVINLDWSE